MGTGGRGALPRTPATNRSNLACPLAQSHSCSLKAWEPVGGRTRPQMYPQSFARQRAVVSDRRAVEPFGGKTLREASAAWRQPRPLAVALARASFACGRRALPFADHKNRSPASRRASRQPPAITAVTFALFSYHNRNISRLSVRRRGGGWEERRGEEEEEGTAQGLRTRQPGR